MTVNTVLHTSRGEFCLIDELLILHTILHLKDFISQIDLSPAYHVIEHRIEKNINRKDKALMGTLGNDKQ